MKRLAVRIAAMAGRAQQAARQLVNEGAQRAAELAREAAPVDTGELRGGIIAEPGETEAAAVSAAAHASMVEYGTRRMAPRPYMQPAAQAARDEFFEAARRAAGEVLK